MYETSYHRAEDTAGASAAMQSAEEGKFLAGGMTLLPTMKQRLAAPTDLIDLMHIEALADVAVSGQDVRIGATTTHADVAGNSDLQAVCPGICDLASHIGDPAVRHRGTIGGSIANNDPAADYPAAMIALNATIVTNQREIGADEFFTGMFETALKDDEVIEAVTFTAPERSAYAKFPNPASRYAMAGVFVADYGGGNVGVGVTGASSGGAYRAEDMQTALAGNFSAEAVDACTVDEGDMLADIHASQPYRANLVKVMARRAVEAC